MSGRGAWEVSLPRFEGPLDLLLALIRRNQYPIEDLPIAEITNQYLDYMRRASGSLNLELSADFAYMASTLIQLKSRSLLPQDPEVAKREHEKAELVEQLLDHERIRTGAEFLRQRLEVASASWSRASGSWGDQEEAEGGSSSLPLSPSPSSGHLNLLDVVRLAKQALDAARAHRETLELAGDGTTAGPTVEEMIAWIERELLRGGLPKSRGADLLESQVSKERQSVLFLALLESAKLERIRIVQEEPFGEWTVESRCGTTVP